VITRKPSLELDGSAVAEYASDDSLRFRASLSGPLIDEKLAFRASLLAARRDGYTRNTEPTGGDFENASDLGGRLAATWFGGDRFEVTVAGDYLRKRGDGNGFVSTLTAPGGAAADPFGPVSSNVGARARSDLDVYGASATAAVWLANGMTVTSITAWRGYEWDLLGDDDGTSLSIAQTATLPEKSDTYSQEFRLNGPEGGHVTWFAGVSAFREDVSNTGAVEGDLKDWLDTGLLAALTGDPSLTSLTALGLPDQPLPFVDLAIGEGKYTSFAVYGDVTWEATERLALTAGLRLARDEKEWSLLVPPVEAFVAAGLADRDLSTPDILPNLLFPSTVPSFNSELSDTSVQPRLVARYQLVPEASVYVSAARGYKPGGFNTFGNRPPFAAESVWSYEAGLKSELLDRRLRLNAALFRYDYEDLQVTVTGSGQLTTINAGKAKGEGIEFEVLAVPLEGLTVGVTGAFLDATYGDSSNPLAAARLPDGNRLTRSPERQVAASLDYAHSAGEGALRWSAQYFWQSEIFFDPDNDAARHGQDAYGVLSASVTYTAPGERVNVSLFADNALDEEYLVNKGGLAEAFGFPVSLRGEPRRVGVRLSYDY
jgi:iron complex outermembrane receptor protein